MDLFETQSVMNEDTFKELKKYLMPQGSRITLITAIIIAACFLIIAAVAKFYTLTGALAVVIIAFILEYVLLLNKCVNVSLKRLQETTQAKECTYTTSFSDIGFKIKNHVTNGTATIAYDDIKRFIETENYYTLFTKTNQFGVINKKAIDEANKKEELINFLKHNCKNIRC